MGGLLGGLNVKVRSHLAPDYPVSFSLVVLPTREGAWDRDAIVRGFWGCPDSASSEWTERTVTRHFASGFESSAAGRAAYPCSGCGRHTSRVRSSRDRIKAVLRRARGMRDEDMLLLKLKWATAHPIRSAQDLVRFLTA